MPELPEVEALRLSLWPYIQNQTVLQVHVITPKLISGKGTHRQSNQAKATEFVNNITGRQIIGLQRRAKNLIFQLSDGGLILVHLKMSGQLVFQKRTSTEASNQAELAPTRTFGLENFLIWGGHPINLSKYTLPSKHTHVIFELTNGTLFYNDTRQFGYLLYYPNQQLFDQAGHFASLGLEPLGPDFTLEYLQTVLKSQTTSLKKMFLDQKVVVGLGNIYADEVSFLSGILPNRPVNTLQPEEIRRLYANIRTVLSQAIADGGSSIASYLLADGTKGNYANKHYVYNRAGQECKICGHQLQKMVLASRTTVYCQYCQR